MEISSPVTREEWGEEEEDMLRPTRPQDALEEIKEKKRSSDRDVVGFPGPMFILVNKPRKKPRKK